MAAYITRERRRFTTRKNTLFRKHHLPLPTVARLARWWYAGMMPIEALRTALRARFNASKSR